jgi:CBS domain-containing protein
MKARDVMNDDPCPCRANDSLAKAVQLMRKHDCGFLPVIDDSRVVGVITDRDICLAAEDRGAPLTEIAVEGVMNHNVRSSRPDDAIADVLAAMRNYRVRRLPVTGKRGKLRGIISISDLARRATHHGDLSTDEITKTLAAICEPRSAEPYA